VAFSAFDGSRGQIGFFRAVRRSKDPTLFIVLFEDSAALIGIALAAAGTFLSHWLDMPVFDPIASLAIGVLLGATAIFLAREAKSLLLGERRCQQFVTRSDVSPHGSLASSGSATSELFIWGRSRSLPR